MPKPKGDYTQPEPSSSRPSSRHMPTPTNAPTEERRAKKPFDKARWREKKYSKKFKLEQWEERRRKAVIHKYHKDLRKEDPTARRPAAWKEEGNEFKKSCPRKPNAITKALDEFKKKKAEKEAKHQMIEKQKAERLSALEQYRTKKLERFKKLSKKTRYGQPVMKDRMELLLEKIQKETSCQSN